MQITDRPNPVSRKCVCVETAAVMIIIVIVSMNPQITSCAICSQRAIVSIPQMHDVQNVCTMLLFQSHPECT